MNKNHVLDVNRNGIKCKEIVNAPSYPSLGHHSVKYLLEMGLPVDMLLRSLEPGRLSPFVKFDTFRSSWFGFSTVWKASIKGVLEVSSLGDYHRRKTSLTK